MYYQLVACVFISSAPGGVQIRPYQSVGRETEAHVNDVRVQHGTVLYCSVVANNAAGLSLLVHADPVTVDLTPPSIDLFLVRCLLVISID